MSSRRNSSAEPCCVVITGASSGLGAGLAVSYAAPGRMLGLIGRNVARLQAVAATCRAKGAEVVTVMVDVADCAAVQAWLAPFDATHRVDLVIANAGISAGTRPNGEPEGLVAAAALVRSNLLGVIHTVEVLLPSMLARGAGHVAVVSSVAGYRGLPDCPAYCASKAGVRAYGESLRAALAPRGIAVSVIVPGFFASPMSRRFLGPKPLLLDIDRAVTRTRAGLDRRAPRIVFPRRMGLLLQVADLLPATLGDLILHAVPFRIAPES